MDHKIVAADFRRAEKLSPSRIVAASPCPIINGKINPQATLFTLADGRMTGVFDVGPKYYLDKRMKARPLTEIALHAGNKRIVLDAGKAIERAHRTFLLWLANRQRLLGVALEYRCNHTGLIMPYAGVSLHEYATMETGGPFNPDADPESVTVDGYVWRIDSTWAGAQGTAAGNNVSSDGATMVAGSLSVNASNFWVQRCAVLFDTSTLGAGAESTSASFEGYVSGKGDTDNDAQAYVNLVQSNPASNTTLAVGDFDAIGDAVDDPTTGATAIDITGVSTDAYQAWTLNATGLGWIAPEGITKLGLREGHDMEDVSVIVEGNSRLNFDTADHTNAPKLTITYTPGFVSGAFGLI